MIVMQTGADTIQVTEEVITTHTVGELLSQRKSKQDQISQLQVEIDRIDDLLANVNLGSNSER